jgi:hypothetical protein
MAVSGSLSIEDFLYITMFVHIPGRFRGSAPSYSVSRRAL